MSPLIIFVRHGQAEHNIAAEKYGDDAYLNPMYRDAKLTPLGHQQTIDAGKEILKIIKKRQVHIYSSPLTRCIETAENILQSGIQANQFQLNDLLLERLHAGHICNNRHTPLEIQQWFPRWNASFLPTFPPHWSPKSEPYESVRFRLNCFIEAIKKKYMFSNTVVIIVSHHDALETYLHKSLSNAEFIEVYY